MSSTFAPRHLLAASAALLALTLSGCSIGTAPTSATTPALSIAGNWKFSSGAVTAVRLPQLAGALLGTTASFTGVLHAATSNACVAPTVSIPVTGQVDPSGNLTMTSSSFAGGSVISLTAKFASGAMSNVNYNVVGGSCSFASTQASAMDATLEGSISGTYYGSFTDTDGSAVPIMSTLQQSTTPDGNGIFHVTGTATYYDTTGMGATGSFCMTNTVVTDSTITGNTLSTTYTQTVGGVTSTVVATGTFDPTATTLTITNWQLTGGCGTDSGTGSLVRH